jgi:hypothetical protein
MTLRLGSRPDWVPFLRTPGSRKPLVLGIFDWPLPPVLYTACGHSVASIIGYAHKASRLVLRGQLFDTVEFIESISDVKEDSLDGSTLGNTSLEALCRRKLFEMSDHVLLGSVSVAIPVSWGLLSISVSV